MIAEVPLPPLDPAHMAHLMAFQAAVPPSEAEDVRRHVSGLTPLGLRLFLWDLARLSLPDAIRRWRRGCRP